jgi:hypothetical protein
MRTRRRFHFAHSAVLSALALAAWGQEPTQDRPWVDRGMDWLLAAQHPDGGWGAGSHAAQNVVDPHAVVTDPATTAFVALALLRQGTRLDDSAKGKALANALDYLVTVVKAAPDEGPRITDRQGTQIQTKLGPLIDTAMTAQALARALDAVPAGDDRRTAVDGALDKCLAKLSASQDADGHWGGGGWAPVLQAATACSAMEMAQASGKQVDEASLEKARDFQRGNAQQAAAPGPLPDAAPGRGMVGDSLTPSTVAARSSGGLNAGVELYAFSSGQRGNAAQAKAAQDLVQQAKDDGRLAEDAVVNQANLTTATGDAKRAGELAENWKMNEEQKERMINDNQLLDGFGNNGGEEYLSYLMSTEALVIDGDDTY